MRKQLKIAYLAQGGEWDRRAWSGISFSMAKAIEEKYGEITYINPIEPWIAPRLGKFCKRVINRVFNKRYLYTQGCMMALERAQIAQRKLAAGSFDLIIAPAQPVDVAFINTNVPLIFIGDSTFASMNNYYHHNLSRLSAAEGHLLERTALKKAAAVIYPSNWAANSAIHEYYADPAKIHIIPFGANLKEVPAAREVLRARKESKSCRLLFLGIEWERKGGSIAFETLMKLRELGVEAELIVCGCTPPAEYDTAHLRIIPFLDKDDPAQLQQLKDLLLVSDFLLLPTRRECYGIAFCEASAFGLPSIATDTGGVSDAVRNGENGYTLPLDAKGEDYARLIYSIHRNREMYLELCRTSRERYDRALNWQSWAEVLNQVVIGQLVADKQYQVPRQAERIVS